MEMSSDAEALAREARYLHQAVFRGAIPEEVVERYIRAHDAFPSVRTEAARRTLDVILSRNLDPEAIELALRVRKGNPALTQKFQILCYLVEVRSAYYPYFVNQRPGAARAAGAMLRAAMYSLGKLLKGCYLVRRYRLV
jgi:hypothetical protein